MASNLRSIMTWKQAVEQFKDHVLPSVVATEKLYGRGPDLPMRRETWNNWTDSLCKNEQISDWQYNNWSQPECCEGQHVQVGDLVEFSAYGQSSGGHFSGLEGKNGVVIDIRHGTIPFLKVHWFHPWSRDAYWINRRELKYVKVKKTLDKATSV